MPPPLPPQTQSKNIAQELEALEERATELDRVRSAKINSIRYVSHFRVAMEKHAWPS